MMGAVRGWLLGVVCTAMVLAAIQSLVPEGSVKKVCRTAGGLALLLAAVGPLLQLDAGALSQMVEGRWAAVQDYEQELGERSNSFYQTIIETTAAAYIVDKAEELDIFCQAEVTFSYDEDGTPCPQEATVWGDWTQEGREAVGRLLEEDLGIPPQRQYYKEISP